MNRRDFLQTSVLASGVWLVPAFLQRLAAAALRTDRATDRVLVVVQLSGGNDGLNTLVPFRDDRYYQARPSLAIPATEVRKVSEEMGFHPQLAPLQPLYDSGKLSLVQNVGYPNPDRSHFRSMDIWHTATDADVYGTNGWLGRYLDHTCHGGDCALTALEIDDTLSLALKGEQVSGFAVSDPERARKTTQSGIQSAVLARQGETSTQHSELDFLYKTARSAYQNIETLYRTAQTRPSSEGFPSGEFGKQLALVASLIHAGLPTQVYYVSLSGFDTHIRQQDPHARLLEQLSSGLAAFQQQLTRSGDSKRVLTLVFSEFGRRVAQNASGGTDHGAGNSLWLMGDTLKKPGFVGSAPDLGRLDRGDVQWQVDFRQVYATLLHDWLNTDDAAILGRSFPKLALV